MTDVSRETPPPPLAGELFGSRLQMAVAYAGLLCGDGVVRGLIGPREGSRVWDRHLLNCALAADTAPTGARVADVGAGAGLPGLVWAIARPDLDVVLIEPSLRRTAFLREAVSHLGLEGSVTVVCARAQEHTALYDVVTARAVAPLDRLARWCLPLVRSGGSMVALKGSAAAQELAGADATIRSLGGDPAIRSYGEGRVEVPTTVVEIVKA